MSRKPEIELTDLQRLAIQATADQDFKPSLAKFLML